jgi:hypothetical protein
LLKTLLVVLKKIKYKYLLLIFVLVVLGRNFPINKVTEIFVQSEKVNSYILQNQQLPQDTILNGAIKIDNKKEILKSIVIRVPEYWKGSDSLLNNYNRNSLVYFPTISEAIRMSVIESINMEYYLVFNDDSNSLAVEKKVREKVQVKGFVDEFYSDTSNYSSCGILLVDESDYFTCDEWLKLSSKEFSDKNFVTTQCKVSLKGGIVDIPCLFEDYLSIFYDNNNSIMDLCVGNSKDSCNLSEYLDMVY